MVQNDTWLYVLKIHLLLSLCNILICNVNIQSNCLVAIVGLVVGEVPSSIISPGEDCYYCLFCYCCEFTVRSKHRISSTSFCNVN